MCQIGYAGVWPETLFRTAALSHDLPSPALRDQWHVDDRIGERPEIAGNWLAFVTFGRARR
jgi:hypothetical protein